MYYNTGSVHVHNCKCNTIIGTSANLCIGAWKPPAAEGYRPPPYNPNFVPQQQQAHTAAAAVTVSRGVPPKPPIPTASPQQHPSRPPPSRPPPSHPPPSRPPPSRPTQSSHPPPPSKQPSAGT